MIDHSAYATDPWSLRESQLDLDVLAQSESLFALSNGHIGWRGNLDEGEPNGLPGSYLNGVYESHPLPYAESGYGYPEDGQTVVNVTDAKLIRLEVNGEPLDVRLGELLTHTRSLDLRTGILRRDLDWISPAGHEIRLRTDRFISFAHRSVGVISYEVESVGSPVEMVVHSELLANEVLRARGSDPRTSTAIDAPLHPESSSSFGTKAMLMHRTKASGLCVAVAMDHLVESTSPPEVSSDCSPDHARVTFRVLLNPGERFRIIKFIAYDWSSDRSAASLQESVDVALVEAIEVGREALVTEQRATLDDLWERADIEVEGDTEIQQAARFSIFHIFQASARTEDRPIPAKGLTGSGYDGHAFWDTETFVLQMLTYCIPEAAADALRWRYTTLPRARARARQLGFDGAVFAWRTIGGAECSAYWPAGTAAFHLGADIADAVVRYVEATGDTGFERDIGVELLVETARLWCSLGHYDSEGRFCIDGVTGPDEYSAIADNNVYTNLMAQHNLNCAADFASRYPDVARMLSVDQKEIVSWCEAAAAMYIPYDHELMVHPQSEGFTRHEVWDFASTSADQYPLLLNFPYFDIYRKQVIKQADLVLAMHLRSEAFTDEQKARNFAYYEPLTVRDSSLSACTQAVIAAEVGHIELAYGYLAEAALMDIENLENNTQDGLHIAALAGTWIALVGGLAGMRERRGTLAFNPRLPRGITRLVVKLTVQDRQLRIEITPGESSYRLVKGEPLRFYHCSEAITVSTTRSTVRKNQQLIAGDPPTQPVGREPTLRFFTQ